MDLKMLQLHDCGIHQRIDAVNYLLIAHLCQSENIYAYKSPVCKNTNQFTMLVIELLKYVNKRDPQKPSMHFKKAMWHQ